MFSSTQFVDVLQFYQHVSTPKKCIFGCVSFSIGGLILDKTVTDPNLAGIIVYAPVINGELSYF